MKYEQISECFISVTLIIEIVEKKRMGYTSVSVLGLEDYLIRLYFQSNFFRFFLFILLLTKPNSDIG